MNIPNEWVEKAAQAIADHYGEDDWTGFLGEARAVLAAVWPEMTAERDALAATVERVRALCEATGSGFPYVSVRDLRAVLASPDRAATREEERDG